MFLSVSTFLRGIPDSQYGSCLQNLRFLREEGVKEELKYSFKVNLALGLLLENAMVAPHFPANRVRAPKIRGIG